MKLGTWNNLPMQVQRIKKYYLIYCRKSSESEDRQVSSNEDQLKILDELANQKNLPILKVFKESKSAKEPGRPEFNEMMALIHKRSDIKGILAWKLNRLHRNPKDAGDLQWVLQSGKIEEVVTPTKTYTEADSDFVMAVEGAQANRFIRDLRDDTIRGLNSKLEKGWFPGLGSVGYINDKAKNQGERDILPHPIYFTLLRKIFDLALTGNYSIFELSKRAKSMGVRNCKGMPISRTQMYRVVTNPFYTGRFVYRGILHQGQHQRMLTDDEFDLLQTIVANKSHPRKIINEAPLNGYIRCGYCEYMITNEFKIKQYKNGKSGKFQYYRCSQKRLNGCPEPYIRADVLEKQVLKFLTKIKLSNKFVNWAIKALNLANEEQKKIKQTRYEALKNVYEGVNKKIQNLFDMRISPENTDHSLITDLEYREQRQKLLIEQSSVKEQLDHLDNTVNDWMELTVNTFDFATKAAIKWQTGGLEDKRRILKAIGEELTLKDSVLEIKPRTPFLMIKEVIEKHGIKPIIGPKDYAQYEPIKIPMSVVGPLANDVRTYYEASSLKELEVYRSLLLS